jgi:hypothetical protein
MDWLQGSGTPGEPHRIETTDQLVLLSQASVLWDRDFQLVADLDLTGVSLRPIGISPGTSFDGAFDGGGHTLSHFGATVKYRYVGLFGYIGTAGRVTDLLLDSVEIQGGRHYVIGCLAGQNDGSISNCGVQGLLSVTDLQVAGGIAGDNSGFIYASHADVTISTSQTSATLGGLVGSNHGFIENSYARGAVFGRPAGLWTGGLVGRNQGRLTDCYASGAVSGGDYVGSLVGATYSDGEQINCYFPLPAQPGSIDNDIGMALNERDAMRRSSYVGWDFENTWMICENRDYPRHQWEQVKCN